MAWIYTSFEQCEVQHCYCTFFLLHCVVGTPECSLRLGSSTAQHFTRHNIFDLLQFQKALYGAKVFVTVALPLPLILCCVADSV